jgi:hypothetical protein
MARFHSPRPPDLSRLFMRLILGPTSKEIDATSEIWQATGTPA